MAAAIETVRLSKSYGSSRGVLDVDLEVFTGEVFGFLGPNGAGKTTTIRVLMDFLRPTSGQARVLGLDSRAHRAEIHRRVGYLPGDSSFYDQLTAGEQLAWLADLRGGLPARVIGELAERVDLDLSRRIGSLSRGNRQKVALVQAFMHRPDLLLLDEPTSGLDPLVQEAFHQMVAEVVADGRTVFLSSHVLDEVDHLCHRVGIIREGRLTAVENVADLRSRAGRNITVRFAEDVDPAPFAALAGVEHLEVTARTISLRTSGDLDELMKLVAAHHVVDLVSAPPELEEIFLRYYEAAEP